MDSIYKPMVRNTLARIKQVHGITSWNVYVILGNELIRIFDAAQMDAAYVRNEYYDEKGNLLAVSTYDSFSVMAPIEKVNPVKVISFIDKVRHIFTFFQAKSSA